MAGATVLLQCSFTQPHRFPTTPQDRRNRPRPTILCCSAPDPVDKKKSTATVAPPKFGFGYRQKKAPRSPRWSLGGIGEDFRVDGVVVEIASIALPALLALAADPLASLVDTAFVGHVGSVELAAVGVSISVFNLVAKLFNVPLLNITTSFVAEEQALNDGRKGSKQDIVYAKSELQSQKSSDNDASAIEGKKYLPAVSSSLFLAAGIGILEAVTVYFGSEILVDIMGVTVDSPMRVPAQHFLAIRALGAPAIVTALAAQGTFRGFLDTKTPLYAVGIGNLVNIILDPILMFIFGLGIDGAAIATVIAEV